VHQRLDEVLELLEGSDDEGRIGGLGFAELVELREALREDLEPAGVEGGLELRAQLHEVRGGAHFVPPWIIPIAPEGEADGVASSWASPVSVPVLAGGSLESEGSASSELSG